MIRQAKIYFDGGCRPNPGIIETCVVTGGAASIRRDLGSGDSHRAEWLALIEAAHCALALPAGPVLLLGDSRSVIAQACGQQTIGSPQRAELAAEYRRIVEGRPDMRLRWIKRAQNLAGIALARDRWMTSKP